MRTLINSHTGEVRYCWRRRVVSIKTIYFLFAIFWPFSEFLTKFLTNFWLTYEKKFPLKNQKTLRTFSAFENKIRKKIVFDNLGFNDRCKKKIENKNEKFAIDSAKQFPGKSILRPVIFTETSR